MNATKQRISVLVRNDPGVLQRVSGLFSRRSYNIDSITVGVSEKENLSRMTVVATGDDDRIRQLCNQLRKLIDVIQVEHLESKPSVARELLLVKLISDPATKMEMNSLVQTFRCSIIDVGMHTVIVQVIGDREKNDAFLQLIRPYGIVEITRTGETAMARG
ncbi:acetolactate synthase small subunit [Cohnella cholangitidis]|uniref:Acetolactate synthase small subunit n=1 Tax=Cohnella cholangitidis TaxID=2598458 RepID=A0A7G5BXE1_9BACL|nr:acetolactate synthase small subunit [Cohnella cholangitidis]QMV41625.1 acetolactate synthase small subunit [Cohnella cholangitidis]